MDALLDVLRTAVGANQVLHGAALDERYLGDWMCSAPAGTPLAVVRPKTTAEVSAVLKACHAHQVPVVPQGGLTGLAGGAVPVPGCVALSLERMDQIEEIDPAAATLSVQAGTPLQVIQEAAHDAGFLFPLDLGARGSCRIGGNLSTNAGGNRVLRYGMTRDLVLGLEVVLADGTVLTHMNKMLKNNTGYDLKQLFIGSEGTLGVITRVVLRLYPQPRSTCTALCAVQDYAAVLQLLGHVKSGLGSTLSAFEMMWPDFYEYAIGGLPHLGEPLPRGSGGYVLVEAMGTDQVSDQERFETVLGEAIEMGCVQDAVIAQNEADVHALWKVRDASGEFHQTFWPHVGFDVSIPTGQLGDFVEACKARLQSSWPEVETVFFGHVGDANVHIAVRVGRDAQPEEAIEQAVYGLVGEWQGSISAEHGIGQLKRPYLKYSRQPAELALMRQIKQAMDPLGILNPGKVL